MEIRELPAFKYLLLFLLGIILEMIVAFPMIILVILIVPVIIALIFLQNKFSHQIVCILCVILCGLLRVSCAEEKFNAIHSIPDGMVECDLHILKQKSNPYYIESYVVSTKINGSHIKGTLYAKKGMPVFIPGKKYHISKIEFSSINADSNIYVFNYLDYAKVHGLSHRYKIMKNAEIIDLGIYNPLIFYSFHARADISTRFLSVLGIEKGSLVNGLLLGLKSEIPPCIADLFRQLGVSHLLAVSGLHVGLIILIIYQILLALSVPRIPRVISIALFLLFYCFLTGGSPSVIRSSFMSLMLLFAPVLKRKYKALNAVAATAVILLLINPFSIKDLGFQFSFSAVFGILIAYPKIRSWFGGKIGNPLMKYFVEMLAVSLSAAIFTSPVAIYYFNSLQLASMLLNLLVIPLTLCVMICAIISLPGLFINTIFSDIALHALDLGLDVFRAILRLASRSSVWTLQISSYWKPFVLCVFIILLSLICLEKKKYKIWTSIFGIMICFIWFYQSSRSEMIRPVLKKGDTVLCRKGRNTLVINTGSAYYNYNDHERYIQPVIEHWGSKHMTLLITKWEKGYSSNVGSIQRKYPNCQVLAPVSETYSDITYIPVKNDTIIKWAGSEVKIISMNKMLSIEYMMKKQKIKYENDSLFVNDKKTQKYYRIL